MSDITVPTETASATNHRQARIREGLTMALYIGLSLLAVMLTLPSDLTATTDPHPAVTLFLTSMGDVEDRVEGLLAGGDDYLVKPFHFSELLARVTSLARRPAGNEQQTRLIVHDLELDLLSHTAKRAGINIDLQAKEFTLLEVLMRNAGRIITKTMLLEQVWDFNFDPKTTVVETHMSRLRAKVDKPFDVPLIHTTRNSGYSIHAPR